MGTFEIKMGLLGLGNRTTLFYIDQINKQYNLIAGGDSTCPFKLYNIDFNTINPYLPNHFEKLKQQLAKYFQDIKHFQTSFWVIPNITLHETLDKLDIEINVIHPVYLTIEKILKNRISKAVVFGSLYTMQSDYLKKAFQQKDIELIEPKEKDKRFLDDFRKKVYSYKETNDEIKRFRDLEQQYTREFPVVISCTELSMLSIEQGIHVFDMAQIQIKKALTKVLISNSKKDLDPN